MSKESESYRLQMLRHLEQENSGPLPPEVTEAERVIAEYRKKQAKARDAIPRASAPLPEPNICPRCWIDHGVKFLMSPISGEGRDTTRHDYWRCRKCQYEERREF